MNSLGLDTRDRTAARILLRLPPALHRRLKDIAAEQGVSVNTLLATLLAGSVGFKMKLDD